MATYNRTSLRIVEARVRPGDTITDSVLIAAEPDTPICAGVKGLTFVRCKFVRCVPPKDAERIDCRSDQRPLPPEAPPEEMFIVGLAELATIVEAARDGRALDVTDFCRDHGMTLSEAREL